MKNKLETRKTSKANQSMCQPTTSSIPSVVSRYLPISPRSKPTIFGMVQQVQNSYTSTRLMVELFILTSLRPYGDQKENSLLRSLELSNSCLLLGRFTAVPTQDR